MFANCVNYKIKLKQSNFERNVKTILAFEHFASQIRDIEKNCLFKYFSQIFNTPSYWASVDTLGVYVGEYRGVVKGVKHANIARELSLYIYI
jgi:hypothetical protein